MRESVNSELAGLISWSFEHASRGRAPDRGYQGEVFCKTSYRSELSGQTLARGWRSLTYTYLFVCGFLYMRFDPLKTTCCKMHTALIQVMSNLESKGMLLCDEGGPQSEETNEQVHATLWPQLAIWLLCFGKLCFQVPCCSVFRVQPLLSLRNAAIQVV